MKDLFITGGSGFMGTLTIIFIMALAWILFHFFMGLKPGQSNYEKIVKRIEYGKSIGLFALVTGFLGQMIGFVAMFDAIELAGDINPNLVYGGLKATMICPIYGVLIYLITLLVWFVGTMIIEQKANKV